MKVRAVIVGGKGVGKTSLLRQIVAGTFSEDYEPTRRPDHFWPYAMVNERVYEIHLVDLPPVHTIPLDSLQEWDLSPGYGLRNASAYILAFDLSDPNSFHIVEDLHAQLVESRPSASIVIVGLKQDLGENERTKEIGVVVRKHWKQPYVECSAKHNWHVTTVMEELVSLIDHNGTGKNHERHRSDSNGRSPTRKTCTLQ